MLVETRHKSVKAFDEIQLKGLKKALDYLEKNSPYYKKLFKQEKIDINNIKRLEDIASLPLTSKEDLQKFNDDFLCVPRQKVAEYCTTSGTLGSPVTIALTYSDLERLALNEYNSFITSGANSNDIFQFMLTLDRQFMAGIAYYEGVRKLGAGLVRVGPGNAMMQLDAIHRFQPTILVAVPSFLVSVIKTAKEKNIDLNSSSVKKIICIGESIREENFSLNVLGQRIRRDWNVELISTYASSEKQTAFTECTHGMGGHHLPELIIYELLDENNQRVAPGEHGELVITNLGVEGMPLLRYQTGDICTYHIEACKCGLQTSRLGPVVGRKRHMIKFNGTTLYPQNIFNVLNLQEDIEDYVVVLRKSDLGTDDLHILVAVENGQNHSAQYLTKKLQSALRISPSIKYAKLSEVQSVQMAEGKRKPSKFVDQR
ncbi:MAG TPA: AMP-binding protein [Bacteroidia bacterium]|nr:AMP-binding protein [Bacteroidia bacterium]